MCLWARVQLTPLTAQAFDDNCRQLLVQAQLAQAMPLAPVHRFLGCLFLRRQLVVRRLAKLFILICCLKNVRAGRHQADAAHAVGTGAGGVGDAAGTRAPVPGVSFPQEAARGETISKTFYMNSLFKKCVCGWRPVAQAFDDICRLLLVIVLFPFPST